VIEVSNLRKKYGDIDALKGLSFRVQAGEIYGLLGPNGARLSEAVASALARVSLFALASASLGILLGTLFTDPDKCATTAVWAAILRWPPLEGSGGRWKPSGRPCAAWPTSCRPAGPWKE
jgi:hypothetical protein